MGKTPASRDTRRDILRAALKRFANCGYAAASVQQIVGDAKVSKPTLYYYFSDKAALFEAPDCPEELKEAVAQLRGTRSQ